MKFKKKYRLYAVIQNEGHVTDNQLIRNINTAGFN